MGLCTRAGGYVHPSRNFFFGGGGTPLLGEGLPFLHTPSVGYVGAPPLQDPMLLPVTCRSTPE